MEQRNGERNELKGDIPWKEEREPNDGPLEPRFHVARPRNRKRRERDQKQRHRRSTQEVTVIDESGVRDRGRNYAERQQRRLPQTITSAERLDTAAD